MMKRMKSDTDTTGTMTFLWEGLVGMSGMEVVDGDPIGPSVEVWGKSDIEC